MAVKKVVVLGASGFLGSHLVIKLKSLGYWVRGVDIIKYPGYTQDADEFFIIDPLETIIDDTIDEVYQLAGSKLSEIGYFW
uniref:NAD-dependent epimerase/dehydratase domain-containing protein n=1 Tax=viral metagenome TaxID=1070528 RepID=A0A6C0ELI7_9ZZZZ